MSEFWEKYGKYAAIAYFLLCILYCIIRIAVPVEYTKGEGLENLGVRQITERTDYLEEGDVLSFTLPVESEPLTSIGFYLNTDEVLLDGTLNIKISDQKTGKLIAESEVLLDKIEADQFVTVPVDHYTDGTVQVELTTSNSTQGPRFWLNSTAKTDAATSFNGTESRWPLVYNAGFLAKMRDVKSAVLTTMTALLFGVVFLAVFGPYKKEKCVKQRTYFQKLSDFYRRNRLVLGAVLTAFLVAMVFFYVYDTQIRIVMNSTEREELVSSSNPEVMRFSEAETEIVSRITCDEERLTGLGVKLAVPEHGKKTGVLSGTVTDLKTGEVLSENVFDMAGAIDAEYMNFIFTHEAESDSPHIFELKLIPSAELKSTELGVYVTEQGELLTQIHKYFNIFLKKYFFFMFAAAEAFAMLLYWMIFVRKCKMETAVLAALLGFGLFYNFLLLPYMSPDEQAHIDMSYRYSNDLLGIAGTGDDVSILKRMDDAKISLTSDPRLANYYEVYHHLFESVQDDTLVAVNAMPNSYAPLIVYFPAVLGMTAARILGLGTIPMLMFARWCNLVFFAICVWWCMKKLPFGKMVLAVIALLPMTIQQCNSFSYDSVITSVLLLFSTYVISLTYEEREISMTDTVILAVLSALLVYGKSGVYLPVCLAVLMIPTKKFGTSWRKYLMAGSLIGIGLLTYINRNSGMVTQIIQTTAETSTVGNSMGNAADMGYTVGYFLQQPWKLVQMLFNTAADKSEFYLESIVGQKMGWIEVEISRIVVVGFIVLFLFAMLKVRGEKQYVTTGQKWWISVVCLLSVGMIIMGMLLTWTPFGNVSVEGVQGRYFIPLLLLASLLGRNRLVLLSENKDRAIFCGAMILQLLTVMYLIKALIVIA